MLKRPFSIPRGSSQTKGKIIKECHAKNRHFSRFVCVQIIIEIRSN